MTTPLSEPRDLFEARFVAIVFLLLGIGIVLYGGRDWMPPLASRHGAGIDTMLKYLLVTTGTLILIAFAGLAWLVWRGGRRKRVVRRFASRRTEIAITLGLGMLMAVVAEGDVLAIGLPVWQEYFEADDGPDDVTIEVTAQQFLWNVRYPGTDGVFGRTDARLVDDVSNPVGLDKSDPLALVLGVVVGLPLNALILYILIAPDALRIFNMVNQE